MIKNLQRAVGTTQDGIAGPATYTALFRKCGASVERAEELGLAAAAAEYGEELGFDPELVAAAAAPKKPPVNPE